MELVLSRAFQGKLIQVHFCFLLYIEVIQKLCLVLYNIEVIQKLCLVLYNNFSGSETEIGTFYLKESNVIKIEENTFIESTWCSLGCVFFNKV